jgi:hypothetical protein
VREGARLASPGPALQAGEPAYGDEGLILAPGGPGSPGRNPCLPAETPPALPHRALGPEAAAVAFGRDPRGGPAVDLTHTGSDAMLFLYLLTSLAGFLTGVALAHHLGYQAGLLPFPAERWDWRRWPSPPASACSPWSSPSGCLGSTPTMRRDRPGGQQPGPDQPMSAARQRPAKAMPMLTSARPKPDLTGSPGFVPEPRRAAVHGGPQPVHLRLPRRHDLGCQRAVTQLKGQVARRQQRQQLRVHRAPALPRLPRKAGRAPTATAPARPPPRRCPRRCPDGRRDHARRGGRERRP